MKVIILFINRIKQYYKKNRLLFVLFILGGIINGLVFCYLYGNLLPMMQNRDSQALLYRKYTVSLEEESDIESIKKALTDTALFECFSLGYEIIETEPKMGYITAMDCFTVFFGEKIPVLKMQGSIEPPIGNEILWKNDFREAVGNKVKVRNEEFIIKGIAGADSSYISAGAYERLFGNQVNKIFAVSFENYAGRNDLPAVFFERTFPGCSIDAPSFYILADIESSRFALIAICFSYTISALAFTLLLVYIMESCAEENIISRIVGASKITMGVMAFWVGVLLSLFSGLLGIILHVVLTPVLFKKLNVNDRIVYSVSDYSLILALMVAISAVIILFFIRRLTKVSPVEAKRIYS